MAPSSSTLPRINLIRSLRNLKMTRINSNLPPKILKRRHLIAEYREILMVPASLRRSLRTQSKDQVLKSIPDKFSLNKGHVKFFYNKLTFLQERFIDLCVEMERRNYKYELSRGEGFLGFDPEFYQNWNSSSSDDSIVMDRIITRISEKPHLYLD